MASRASSSSSDIRVSSADLNGWNNKARNYDLFDIGEMNPAFALARGLLKGMEGERLIQVRIVPTPTLRVRVSCDDPGHLSQMIQGRLLQSHMTAGERGEWEISSQDALGCVLGVLGIHSTVAQLAWESWQDGEQL